VRGAKRAKKEQIQKQVLSLSCGRQWDAVDFSTRQRAADFFFQRRQFQLFCGVGRYASGVMWRRGYGFG
jgi:hypothetical protein